LLSWLLSRVDRVGRAVVSVIVAAKMRAVLRRFMVDVCEFGILVDDFLKRNED
jgi:hypothetical protein